MNFNNFPLNVFSATGGLIRNTQGYEYNDFGSTAIICGGEDGNAKTYDDCYKYNGQKWRKFSYKMTTKRQSAASMILNDTILWISGGNNGDAEGDLKSSEFIRLEGEPEEGPELETG